MLPHPLRRAFLVLVLAAAACSRGDPRVVVLPSFSDVSAAPQPIQVAAQAVVRIGTAGEVATGSFVTPTGVLLTNNHVLGVDVCPQEGCYAQLTFMHQRHAPISAPQTVFVVPIAVDVGLDMAAVQVYPSPGAAPLETPHYLTLAPRGASSLHGAHVHVVGHPEGHLKKWTQGQVVDSDGVWIWFTAYSLPGSSGSPVLDDDGHMVGILHRGPTAQDLVSSRGVDEYSIGTSSDALIAAMSAPLPAAMRSTQAAVTDDEVAERQILYLNARAPTATVDGMPRAVLASLAVKCDAGLARKDYASPEDFGTALAPCVAAERWIECRTDAKAGGFGVCPQDSDAWLRRYEDVYAHRRALNGGLALDMVSFAPAALAASNVQGVTDGAQKLTAALTAAQAPLDFGVANYLAAFDIDSYGGVTVRDFLRAYANGAGYFLSGTAIASTALWLNHDGKLSASETRSLLQSLASDDQIAIGTKLYVEDVLYESAALD